MTLTEFLLERIAEDEAQAKRSKADDAMNPNLRIPAGWVEGVANRVLAECEAKRRIVEYARRAALEGDGMHFIGYRAAMADALAAFAAIYADHPDYLPEWRP